MTLESLNPAEKDAMRENLIITPESLYTDNRSEKVIELSAKWEENRDKGKLWAIVACGDARVLMPKPENIISIRSIATCGKKEKKIFESQGVKFAVVMSHIDGETIVNGKKPSGCGGAAAKEQSMNGHKEKTIEGIQYYIDNNIEHPDPIIQGAINTETIAKQTGKPTLAVIQDHKTGRLYPFAASFDGYDIVSSNINWINLFKGYNESEIYAQGIPTLPEAVIPDMFKEFLDAGKENMIDMLRNYPSLKEMQKVQNPKAIWISSKITSVRISYPKTGSVPGSIFKLHMPREKTGGKIEITPTMQKEVINQAQYPIEYATAHFKKPNESFSKTDRLIIETSDINVSKKLATELVKKPWMQEWIALPDHKILIIQNQEGISNIIDEFA